MYNNALRGEHLATDVRKRWGRALQRRILHRWAIGQQVSTSSRQKLCCYAHAFISTGGVLRTFGRTKRGLNSSLQRDLIHFDVLLELFLLLLLHDLPSILNEAIIHG